MIECQGRRSQRRMPLSLSGVIAGPDLAVITENSSEYNADRMAPGITAGIAECSDLLQANSLDPGFFFEFPQGSMFEWFILVDESTRQCPFPLEWVVRPPDQQHLDFISRAPEQGYVGGDCGARVVIAIPRLPGVAFSGC